MNNLIKLFASYRDLIIRFVSLSLFFILWEALPTFGYVDPFFTSSPSRIFITAQEMLADDFLYDIQISLIEFFWGMLFAIFTGVLIGLLLGWYKKLHLIFEPFITMLNATPRVALIPLIILWVGIGIESKILAVFLGAFFPLVISAMKSVKTLDENLLRCARSFGASDNQIFRTLILPNSAPFIVAGLHIAIGRGLIGVVVGEMLASKAGVGHVMSIASATFQTDKVFVGLIFLASFGYLLTKVVEVFENRFNKWRPL